MKRVAILIVLVAFAACKEISFKESQPKGKKPLKAVPKKIWGQYILPDEEGGTKDTLYVKSEGYSVGSPNDQLLLSDSLVMKAFDGYYFLNLHDDPQWYLRVLKQDDDGNLIFMTLGQENTNFDVYLENLSGEIKVDSFQTGNGKFYQIDPAPKQLISIIEKGYVKKTILKKLP